MNRSTFLLPLLGAIACDPLPKNAGEVDTDTDTGASATDSADSGDRPPPFPTQGFSLGEGQLITHLVASDLGVVAVILAGEAPYDITVTEYDATMTEAWSLSLGEGDIRDLAALPEGGFVVGGAEGTTAAAWRLSCCGTIEDQQQYPTMSGAPAAITVAQPLAGGVFLVRDAGAFEPDFISADLDLVPVTVTTAPGFSVVDGAVSPSGTVILSASEGGEAHLIYEVEPDGTGSGVGPGEAFRLVGTGADLTMVTLSNPDGINVRDWESGPVIAVNVPDMVTLPSHTFEADRREHYAIAHPVEHADINQVFTHLAEFESDGTLIRQGSLAGGGQLVVEPAAVAIANDGATWVATKESPTGAEMLPNVAGMLQRLQPL